jgi:ribose transport system permease protein
MLIITLLEPKFLSSRNMFSVSRQISFVAIVALGELFVILTAGIDLSVGSVLGLSGVISGYAMSVGIDPVFAVLLGLLTGFLAGIFSGFIVSYLKITPFIVTLGMLSICRGAIWVITKGWPITEISKDFIDFGLSNVLGIPMPVVIMVFCALICHIILRYTAFGRRTFAIGGNEEATALSGIDIKKIKLFIYGISGLLSAVTGVILVARFNSAQPAMGEGWELDAIAATVIGGTSLMGGAGSVLGVLIGAAIMGIIRNGLVLLRVSVYWQTLIIGVIIILATLIDRIKNK